MLKVACGGSVTVMTYRVKCGDEPYYVKCASLISDKLQYESHNYFRHSNGPLTHGEREYTKFDVEGELIPNGSMSALPIPSTLVLPTAYGEFVPSFGGNCLVTSPQLHQLRRTFDLVVHAGVAGRYSNMIQTNVSLILPCQRIDYPEDIALIVAQRSSMVNWDEVTPVMQVAKAEAEKLKFTLAEAMAITTYSSLSFSYQHAALRTEVFKRPTQEPLIDLDWAGLLDQFEPNFTDYDRRALLGEMSQDIADSVRPYRTNVFESLLDIPSANPCHTLSQVLRTVGERPLKAASDLALESQYGFNLTVKDAQAFANALLRARDLSRVYRSRRDITYRSVWGTKSSVFCAKAKVRRESDAVISFLDDLYSVGVMPTLSGAWDLVPFSFVIDWFLPIGDLLAQLDAGPELATLPLDYILLSEDKRYSLDSSAVSHLTRCSGTVEIHRYSRWIQHTFPPVYPHFTGLQKPHPNWVAAAALLIGRKSR